MAVFRLTQVIDRPVEEVFQAVIHIEDFPKWSPQNPSARRLDGGEIGEGSRFEMEIRGFGVVLQELQEFEPNRQVRIVPHIKQIKGGHRFAFAGEGRRTRVKHELEMTPNGVYWLMMPMMLLVGRRNLRITADALKKHLEGGSAGAT